MARIPLVGQAYPARSPAVSVQSCINVYPEPTQDPQERAKGIGALYGCPGRHLVKTLTDINALATPLRGLLMVNGRLFVAAGVKFFELDSTYALVGSVYDINDDSDHSPVQMFTNGGAQQIMIVSAGICYVYDGFSVNPVDLPAFTGIVDTDGKTVYYSSGDKFDPSMAAQAITIGGKGFTVDQVLSPDVLTVLTTTAQTITAASNAAAAVITIVGHGLLTGAGVTISGFTGNWAAANATWTITVLSANTFSIPLDSTAFGAIAGTPIADYYNTTYVSTIPHMLSVTGAVLDGYFIVSRKNSTKFNISPLLDGANNGTWVWDQLDFGNKESTPDYLRSVLAANEQLYLFGADQGGEVWQNTGAESFPFERINGATFNVASVSPWGPIELGGRVYFIGGSKGRISAYVMDGFTPKRVSTHALESEWNTNSFGPNCVSYAYEEEGHQFWVINFGSQAWAFDPETGAWHQRAGYSAGAFTAYGTKYHVYAQNSGGSANDWGAGGKHLTGGDGTANLYESSINFYDDNGSDMKWQRALPYQYAGGKRIFFGRLQLEMQTGSVASGAAPDVTRDYSDDRGQTFINPVTASIGVHDDFSTRVFWPSNGSCRTGRVFRFSGVGQYKVALVDCELDVTVGAG